MRQLLSYENPPPLPCVLDCTVATRTMAKLYVLVSKDPSKTKEQISEAGLCLTFVATLPCERDNDVEEELEGAFMNAGLDEQEAGLYAGRLSTRQALEVQLEGVLITNDRRGWGLINTKKKREIDASRLVRRLLKISAK